MHSFNSYFLYIQHPGRQSLYTQIRMLQIDAASVYQVQTDKCICKSQEYH